MLPHPEEDEVPVMPRPTTPTPSSVEAEENEEVRPAARSRSAAIRAIVEDLGQQQQSGGLPSVTEVYTLLKDTPHASGEEAKDRALISNVLTGMRKGKTPRGPRSAARVSSPAPLQTQAEPVVSSGPSPTLAQLEQVLTILVKNRMSVADALDYYESFDGMARLVGDWDQLGECLRFIERIRGGKE